jgi:hypothetical protein
VIAPTLSGCLTGWAPNEAGLRCRERNQEADQGSLCVGAPVSVARKIAATTKVLGISRFDIKYSAGPLSHEKLMRSVEL